jgi:arylsulfatase A-like enzyme
MMKAKAFSSCVCGMLFLAHFSSFVTGAIASQKPNIIVILADDLGYADVGCNGCQDIATPRIDALAAQGVRCTAGYVTHPYCSPSRAGLLAGRYQQRFGHEANPSFEPDNLALGLPVTETLFPALLQKAGYRTAAIGKWHLGAAPQFHPNARGFDHFFGFLGGTHDYFASDVKSRRPEITGLLDHNGEAVPFSGYLTTALGREATRFIREHCREPFFLYLPFNAPHTPLQATDDLLRRHPTLSGARQKYAALVSGLDDEVGRVLDTLAETQLAERTLVFFLSDNGGTPDHGNNSPLRGYKGTTFEGGVRVPFLVSWPGTLPAGKSYDHPVSALDIAATTLALAGADHPERGLDGVNLLPFLTGAVQTSPHDTLYWRVSGGWDYAVLHHSLKLCKPGLEDRTSLFDLTDDLMEKHDLATAREAEHTRLQSLYESWNRANIEPLWNDDHRTNAARGRR